MSWPNKTSHEKRLETIVNNPDSTAAEVLQAGEQLLKIKAAKDRKARAAAKAAEAAQPKPAAPALPALNGTEDIDWRDPRYPGSPQQEAACAAILAELTEPSPVEWLCGVCKGPAEVELRPDRWYCSQHAEIMQEAEAANDRL